MDTWSSIVLGQALALVVQTVAACGYGVNGPAEVARRGVEDGISYFRMAQRTRMVVAAPCFAIMICLMFAIPNANPVAGLLGSAHLAIGAFSATFYYIGRASPLWLLYAETIPRALGMFSGAITLALGAPLFIGLSLPGLGAVVAVLISNGTILRSMGTQLLSHSPPFSSVRAELRIQRTAAAASMLRGARDAIPVFVITVVAADLLGPFGVYERVQRQTVGALAPLTSTLQGWVPQRMAADRSARPVLAALVGGFAGASIIFIVFAAFGATLIEWLAAGAVVPTLSESLLCSAIIATGILNQVVAFACLVPLGGIKDIIWGNIVGIGAAIIVPIAVLSLETSIASALLSLLLATVTQTIFQLIFVVRRISRRDYLQKIE